MHLKDQNLLSCSLYNFQRAYPDKFKRGAAEHSEENTKPLVDNRQLLQHAEDEILDLWAYIAAIKQRCDSVRALVGTMPPDNEWRKKLEDILL